MSKVLVVIAAFSITACSKDSDAQQKASAGSVALALRPANGDSHDAWLKQWQEKLIPDVTLRRGEHEGEVQGSYYSRVKVQYPVFLVTLNIRNRTGRRVESSKGLYLVQTSVASAADKRPAIEVLGGAFRETPSEDYAGVVEIRGGTLAPNQSLGLIDAVDSASRRGFFGSAVDMLLTAMGGGNQLERRFANASGFGSADDGQSLMIESNDLQLTVRVLPSREGAIFVVSPQLTVQDVSGVATSFRYVFRFDNGAETPSASTLVAIDDESLLPLLLDSSEPLWRRVFAAGWATDLSSPTAGAALLKTVGSEAGEPRALRAAAIRAVGSTKVGSAAAATVARDRKEPWQLRQAAAWALGASTDSGAEAVLRTLLRDSDNRVRTEAIEALAARHATAAKGDIMALLSNRDAAETVGSLAAALAELGDRQTAESLTVLGTKRADLRRRLIPVIRKLSGDASIAALGSWYELSAPKGTKDEQWPVRMDACEQLSGVADSTARALLDRCLSDTHDWVRSAAIRTLAKPVTAARMAQLVALAGDTNLQTARAAIRTLGSTGRPDAKVELLRVIANQTLAKERRWAAIEGIQGYKEPAVAAALLKAVSGEADANLRADSYEALSAYSSDRERSAMDGGLRDSSAYVVGRVAGLLRKQRGIGACTATLDALVIRSDGEAADKLVGLLMLPGCRERKAFDKVVARLGARDSPYDAQLRRLLKSWTGEDAGVDKEKWATAWK